MEEINLRVPNELLQLFYEGGIQYRKTKGRQGIPIGCVPLLLALCSYRPKYFTNIPDIEVRMAELLERAAYPRTRDGSISRYHRQFVKESLVLLHDLDVIQVEGDVEQWGHKSIVIRLHSQYFRGLRVGGNGFSVISNRVITLLRKALKGESKSLCAVPLVCYLARAQKRLGKGFVPDPTPCISSEALMEKLGFMGKGRKVHQEALKQAFEFLVKAGVLLELPKETPAAFGYETVLTFTKSPAYFTFTDKQLATLRKHGHRVQQTKSKIPNSKVLVSKETASSNDKAILASPLYRHRTLGKQCQEST